MKKYRYHALAITFAILLVVFYGYTFPQNQYFKCDGRGYQKNTAGEKSSNYITEYLIVSKYLYGFMYTLDQYKLKECQNNNNEIECYSSATNRDDWLVFDFIKGELTGDKGIQIKGASTVIETFTLSCTKISRAID